MVHFVYGLGGFGRHLFRSRLITTNFRVKTSLMFQVPPHLARMLAELPAIVPDAHRHALQRTTRISEQNVIEDY